MIQSAVVACDETFSIMEASFICALLYRSGQKGRVEIDALIEAVTMGAMNLLRGRITCRDDGVDSGSPKHPRRYCV